MNPELMKLLEMPHHWYVDLQVPMVVSTVRNFTPMQNVRCAMDDFSWSISELKSGALDKPLDKLRHRFAEFMCHLYLTQQFQLLIDALTAAGLELEARGHTREHIETVVKGGTN